MGVNKDSKYRPSKMDVVALNETEDHLNVQPKVL